MTKKAVEEELLSFKCTQVVANQRISLGRASRFSAQNFQLAPIVKVKRLTRGEVRLKTEFVPYLSQIKLVAD